MVCWDLDPLSDKSEGFAKKERNIYAKQNYMYFFLNFFLIVFFVERFTSLNL